MKTSDLEPSLCQAAMLGGRFPLVNSVSLVSLKKMGLYSQLMGEHQKKTGALQWIGFVWFCLGLFGFVWFLVLLVAKKFCVGRGGGRALRGQ